MHHYTSAQAEVDAVNEIDLKSDPFAATLHSQGFLTRVKSLHAEHVESVKPVLLLLQGGVFLLLLIAGVNLVNLLLIRASGRAQEFAVRQALGASGRHITNEVVLEIVLLALGGGLLGLLSGTFGLDLLGKLGVNQLPLGAAITLDGRVAVFSLLGTLGIGCALAAPIVWFQLQRRLLPALQAETRGGTAGRAAQRVRHGFIIVQVAIAFMLLTGAGQLGLSLKRVLESSPGFQADHVLAGHLTLAGKNYADTPARLAFIERLLPALSNLPGVSAVAIGTSMPFSGDNNSGSVAVEGVSDEMRHAHRRNGVSGDYWRALGIPLVAGRFIEETDSRRAERVCVVDEEFARRYWPGQSVLGRRITSGGKFVEAYAATIVGVVGAVKHDDLADTQPLGTVYFPYGGWADSNFSVIVRSMLAPEAVVPLLQRTVQQLDPELPIDDIRPILDRIDDSLVPRRSPAVLAAGFACVALLLAAIGTYGVLAYAVAQRRREIGVRMALGALPRQVLAQFLGLGARLLVAGLVLGAFGAWAAGHAMRGVLANSGALPVEALLAGAAVLSVVVFLAVFLPARRAARIDPLEVLRAE